MKPKKPKYRRFKERKMYLIVGLGNPEPEYSQTRHNMGVDVINQLAKKYKIPIEKKGLDSLYSMGMIGKEKVILCKPQTFMNLSGEAIIKFINYYKIEMEKVIIIYDDIDLEPGIVKIRKKGGAGTHNGMKSVIENLQTTEFPHVRIGTGHPLIKSDLVHYVIGKVTKEEYAILSKGIETGVEAVEKILKDGIDMAMNQINVKN